MVHVLMIAIIIMTIAPIIGAIRYSKSLGSALELACVPQIKSRARDHNFERNWITCVQHRQLVTLYYPFVVFAMIFNTLAIWYMFEGDSGVPTGYLIAYCALASGYGFTSFYFQSQPLWLTTWINYLELTRATINLEQVTAAITKAQSDLTIAYKDVDYDRIADIERQLKHLVGLGEIYNDEITEKEKPH